MDLTKGGFQRRHNSQTYRSGLEDRNNKFLKENGVKFAYEKFKITYEVKPKTYTPDFLLLSNNIIIETKGIFDAEDRTKHLAVKEQHPDLDIRFVFTNSKSKLYKGSKTTYGDWCEKNGYLYADKFIPLEWTQEPAKPLPDYIVKQLKQNKVIK